MLEIEPTHARRITVVGLDVDGVMTDGGIYIGGDDTGMSEFKRFDVADGIGIRLMRSVGIKIAIVTGRLSPSTQARARELQVDEVIEDSSARKIAAFEDLLARWEVRIEDAAFIGDDLPDIPVLRRVGLPVAVKNAVSEVKAVARNVTERPGGFGAIREFSEALLKARNEWDEAVNKYLMERGEQQGRTSVAG